MSGIMNKEWDIGKISVFFCLILIKLKTFKIFRPACPWPYVIVINQNLHEKILGYVRAIAYFFEVFVLY